MYGHSSETLAHIVIAHGIIAESCPASCLQGSEQLIAPVLGNIIVCARTQNDVQCLATAGISVGSRCGSKSLSTGRLAAMKSSKRSSWARRLPTWRSTSRSIVFGSKAGSEPSVAARPLQDAALFLLLQSPCALPHLCELPDDAVALLADEVLHQLVAEDGVLVLCHLHAAVCGRQDLKPSVPRQRLRDNDSLRAAFVVHLHCGCWSGLRAVLYV